MVSWLGMAEFEGLGQVAALPCLVAMGGAVSSVLVGFASGSVAKSKVPMVRCSSWAVGGIVAAG